MRTWLLGILACSALSALAATTGTVVNAEGQPVAGAKVSAFAPESPEERLAGEMRAALATAQTDAKGNFSIDVKGPVVDLRVEGSGLGPVTERVVANDDAGVLLVGGVAWTRGTISASGKPLAGAVVSVEVPMDSITTTTDASGRYALPDPKRGMSRVVVRHPEYAIAERRFAPFLSTKPDIVMTRGVAVSGRVVAEDGETAVANAAIVIDGHSLATTGEDGAFAIAHAPANAKSIAARVGNRIAFAKIAKDKPLVLRLAAAAAIAGSVRDAKSGAPIAGAEVGAATKIAGGTDKVAWAITDAKGNFAIGGLAGGAYELAVLHPGYAGPLIDVEVPPGGAAQKRLQARPLARIAGSVIDEDRRGIGGVRVSVSRTKNAISAADGRFVLRTEEEGELQADAVKKGLPAARSGKLRVAGGERMSGVTITMPRGVALTGRVIDRDGKAIAGAGIGATESGPAGAEARRAAINSISGEIEDLVRSGADGTFTLRLQEGKYDLYVTARGYAPATLRAREVSAGTKPLEIELDAGVEISGRVTRGGAPVEGVTIFTIGSDAIPPVQTGGDGAFVIQDLAPGQLMLSFRKPEAFVSAMRAVTAPARDVDVELPAGGRVAGRVIDKATQQPMKAFEAGVAQTHGRVMAPPDMRGFTSEDGTFAIDAVPAGAQTLVVNAPGYRAGMTSVKVENGASVDNLEVALEKGVRVTGHVTGPGRRSVAGALVMLDPGESMQAALLQSTETDADGTYELDDLAPGEITLVFSSDGLLEAHRSVTLSGPSTEVDVELKAGESISGIVVTGDGAPVAEADVRAAGASARTDAAGTFVLEGLPPGHYDVGAGKSGYQPAVVRDVVIPGARAIRLVLERGGVIAGRVTGLAPAELRSAVVFASSSSGNATATVNDDGSYRMEGAPLGTVRVSARTGELTHTRAAPAQALQVEPGVVAAADFDFTSDITIRGRISRGGAAVPSANVLFVPKGSGLRAARATADTAGRYEIAGVDRGSYTVAVSDFEMGQYSTPYDVTGSATFDIDIRGTTLSGRVLDASTGAPIANASVDLHPPGTSQVLYGRSTSSDADGAFSFEQVAAGRYEASARKSGYGGATAAVSVDDGVAPPVELKLTPSAGLALRVVDARDQRPLGGWYHATSSGGETWEDDLRAGSSIPLAAGTWRVTVGAPGYASQTVTATSPGEQTVGLTRGGSIAISSTGDSFARARLVDAWGQPYRLDRGTALFRIYPAPGITRLDNIAAGTYTLQVVDDANRVLRATQVMVSEGQLTTARL